MPGPQVGRRPEQWQEKRRGPDDAPDPGETPPKQQKCGVFHWAPVPQLCMGKQKSIID
jgi:hypothetical protein